MDRRSALGVFFGFSAFKQVASGKFDQGAFEAPWLKSQLVTSADPDDSSMDEISARFAWVMSGYPLPEDAHERTVRRANSDKPDYVGIWPKREDVSVTKRCLCFAILHLHDKLREIEKQSP